MRRREFISFAGGVALAWSLSARAQEPGRVYRIAIVVPVGRDEAPNLALIDELRRLGFVEGENLLIVPGGFLTTNEQVAEVVPAMIKAAPDVIVVGGDPISRAFQKATQSIPLLVMTEDMVGAGFAASLARPGGNITGISLMSPELDGKRQDILIEAVPTAHRIAALADSNVSTLQHLKGLEDSARTHGRELVVVRAASANDIAIAINDASTRGVGALNVLGSPMLHLNRRPSSNVRASYDCPRSINGRRQRKKAACLATVRVSLASSASAPGWLLNFFAAPSPPICRSSNRAHSSSSLT